MSERTRVLRAHDGFKGGAVIRQGEREMYLPPHRIEEVARGLLAIATENTEQSGGAVRSYTTRSQNR